MRKFGLTLLAAGVLLCSSSAKANMITVIASQDGGVTDVTLVPPTSSPITFGPTICCGVGSAFALQGTVDGTPPLGSLDLLSNLIVSSFGIGTINIWVTETGLTSPVSNVVWTSGLTSNVLVSPITMATLATFVSPTNGTAPPTGSPIASQTFNSFGAQMFVNTVAAGTGTFSIQHEYTVVSTGIGGTSNLTIDLMGTPVPEPASFMLLGAVFTGFGLLRRRRRTVS